MRRWIDGESDGREITQIVLSRDGMVFLVGSRDTGSDQDMYLGKFRQDGSIIWERTFGGSGDDSASQLQETSRGDLYLIGSTRSPEWPFSEPGLFGRDATRDLVLLKLDRIGIQIE